MQDTKPALKGMIYGRLRQIAGEAYVASKKSDADSAKRSRVFTWGKPEEALDPSVNSFIKYTTGLNRDSKLMVEVLDEIHKELSTPPSAEVTNHMMQQMVQSAKTHIEHWKATDKMGLVPR